MSSEHEIGDKLARQVRAALKAAGLTASVKRKGSIKGLAERSRGYEVAGLGRSCQVSHADPMRRGESLAKAADEAMASYRSALESSGKFDDCTIKDVSAGSAGVAKLKIMHKQTEK